MTLFVSDKFYAPFECRRVIVIQKDVEIASYLTALNNGAIIKKENYLTAQQVVDSLTSTANDVPLSANQGKVLKDLIDSLIIKGAGAPTTSTVGTVGKLYEDTTNGDLYQCTAVSGSTYTWEEVGGGGGGDPVYSTVQTSNQKGDGAVYIGAKDANNIPLADPSTTDNHRKYFWALPWDTGGKGVASDVAPPDKSINIGGYQRSYNSYCTTIGYMSRVDGDGNTCFGFQTGGSTTSQYSTFIGGNARADTSSNYQTALGYETRTNAKSSVALGAKSTTSIQGEVSIGGSSLGTDGYNNTSYRKITNVYDGENAHDAATLAQGNTLASSAPTTSTVGVVGQLYTDTSTGKLYHCTAVSGSTYTWEEVGGGGGGGGDPVYSTIQTSNSATGGAVYIGNKNANQEIVEDPSTSDTHKQYFWALPQGGAATAAPANHTVNILGGKPSTTWGSSENSVYIGYQVSDYTNSNGIGIGAYSQPWGAHSVALGSYANTNQKQNSIALGYYAKNTRDGELSLETQYNLGYNNTNYKVISGVYDGQEPHDAVNKQQLDAALAQIQALEARIAALEGNV